MSPNRFLTPIILAVLLGLSSSSPGQHASNQSGQHPNFQNDYRPYPIDPRKPCSICSRPNDPKAIPLLNLPGLRGRPHVDATVGGCRCSGHRPGNPMKSEKWSLPFSALREQNHPEFSAWLDSPCRPRLTNIYDRLGDIQLSPYKRTDNGHCGPGRDPYGCLGQSKILPSQVRGVQFRQPGEPVFGSPQMPTPSIAPGPLTAPGPTTQYWQTYQRHQEAQRRRNDDASALWK